MRPLGPVALWGSAAALAVVGAGLLLPVGGVPPPDPAGESAVAGVGSDGPSVVGDLGRAAGPSGVLAPAAASASPSAQLPAAGVPAAGVPDGAVTADLAPTATPGPSPVDRLAGPVPDDEIALAFAAAVPAVEGLDPASAELIIDAATAGLVDWYAEAGWRDFRVQAAVVTDATAVLPAAAVTASVAALWSGDHPVLGPTDRRYATVTLTAGEAPTADDPGTAWTVDSIEGGAVDG